jgi:hypothetical protein
MIVPPDASARAGIASSEAASAPEAAAPPLPSAEPARVSMRATLRARADAWIRRLLRVLEDERTLRDLAPLVLPLALLPFLAVAFGNYVPQTLYFDAINYQYTAWCVRHGERLYRTVGVPDGPFITVLHALVQMVVGESDHAFRRADLWIQTLGSAAIGAALAPGRRWNRLIWALVGAALWLSYYLTFDWHWTIEREAYYSLFGFLGASLMYASTTAATRRSAALLAFGGGALAGMQILGKHTGVTFVGCGLFAVWAGRPAGPARRVALRNALAGVAAGVAVMLAFIVIWGSLPGFVFWFLRFPAAYRNAMVGADAMGLALSGDGAAQELAAYALLGGLAAVATGLLPRRTLGFVLAPPVFFMLMALQRKGYPYHMHPIHAGSCVLALIILAALFGHRREARRWTGAHALAAVAAIGLVGSHAVAGMRGSPWLHPNGHDEHEQEGQPHGDFPAMLETARYLRAHTAEHDRVFAFGPAPQVLFSAGRATAVPEFDNYFFNIHRATTASLSPSERVTLDRLQADVAATACPRIRERPAAMIFCDGAEWSGGSGIEAASEVCPEIRTLVQSDYQLGKSAGCWRVYLRKDRTP